jgi:hypothetical protein
MATYIYDKVADCLLGNPCMRNIYYELQNLIAGTVFMKPQIWITV